MATKNPFVPEEPSAEKQLQELQAKWAPFSVALEYLEKQKKALRLFQDNIRAFFKVRKLPTTAAEVISEVKILRDAIHHSKNQDAMAILKLFPAEGIDITPASFTHMQGDIVNGEVIRELENLEIFLLDYLQQHLSGTQRALLTKQLEGKSIFAL